MSGRLHSSQSPPSEPAYRAGVRRLVVPAVACAAAFLLTGAGMLRWYVAPLAARLPLAPDLTLTLTGSGSGYDVGRGAPVAGALREELTIRGDPGAGDPRIAVWDVRRRLLRADATLVRLDTERVALDRRTALAVACCGESPRHSGLTFAFPPGVGTEAVPLYDALTGRTAPARYAGAATVAGLPAYRFDQVVPTTGLGLHPLPGAPPLAATEPGAPGAGSVPWRGSDRRTLWVEPTTGSLVDATEHPREEAVLPDGRTVTLLDADLTLDQASTRALAEAARRRLTTHSILAGWAPLAATLAGAVLLPIAIGYRIVADRRPPRGGRSAIVRARW